MSRETIQAMLAGATVTVMVILTVRALLRIKRRWYSLESDVRINTGNNEWARRDLRELLARTSALEKRVFDQNPPRAAAKGEG